MPRADQFELDSRPPAYRTFELKPDGTLDDRGRVDREGARRRQSASFGRLGRLIGGRKLPARGLGERRERAQDLLYTVGEARCSTRLAQCFQPTGIGEELQSRALERCGGGLPTQRNTRANASIDALRLILH